MNEPIQMNPAKIELLLHYYYSPNEISNWDAPGTQSDIKLFCNLNIFSFAENEDCTRKVGQLYINVKALEAYVNELTKIQPPKKQIIYTCERVINNLTCP